MTTIKINSSRFKFLIFFSLLGALNFTKKQIIPIIVTNIAKATVWLVDVFKSSTNAALPPIIEITIKLYSKILMTKLDTLSNLFFVISFLVNI